MATQSLLKFRIENLLIVAPRFWLPAGDFPALRLQLDRFTPQAINLPRRRFT